MHESDKNLYFAKRVDQQDGYNCAWTHTLRILSNTGSVSGTCSRGLCLDAGSTHPCVGSVLDMANMSYMSYTYREMI